MKIPEIQIYPVREWFRLLDEHSISFERTAAIICSSFYMGENKLPPIHLVSHFDDVDRYVSGKSLTIPEARRIARFICDAVDNEIDRVYVCCDEGISRSSAVAAALKRFYGLDDMDIWSSPHYHPNPLVYRMLLDCLDMPVDSGRLDLLVSINRQAHRNRPCEGE